MSDFAKDGFHKAASASASIHVTRFMHEHDQDRIKKLQAFLASQEPTPQP